MTGPVRRVAVIAHAGKTLGGGLDELRRLITAEPIEDLRWHEVQKSREAPKKIKKALRYRPDLIVVWGGDGMVQRCADTLAGHEIPIAIMPAGTANLLGGNLGIPDDLEQAVLVAFHGGRRRIDLGRFNGEHFAVMAGAGFDAEMIDGADGPLKRRLGRFAYLWSGAAGLRSDPVHMKIKLDGARWFTGDATCVLVGNVAKVFGAIELFDGARPDDGYLDVGVTTASNPAEWARAIAAAGTGPSDRSPYVRTARARRISVKLSAPLRYELDGGSRTKTTRVKVRVVPSAASICVPLDPGIG